MVLEIGIWIMIIAFISFIIFVFYFLGHVEYIFGFKNETNVTEATLKRFVTRGSGTTNDPISRTPVIEYYNAFLGKYVEKEMLNCGILAPKEAIFKNEKQRVANVGDKIKVEYTKKRVRVIDPKFVKPNKYKLSRFIKLMIASVSIGFVGFVLFIISFLSDISFPEF